MLTPPTYTKEYVNIKFSTYLKYIDSVEDDSISACQLHQNKGTNKQKKWFKSRWFSQFM